MYLALFEFRPCNHNLKNLFIYFIISNFITRLDWNHPENSVLPSKVGIVLDTGRGWRMLLVKLKVTPCVGQIFQVVFYRWRNVHRCARLWDELNLLRWTHASATAIVLQQMFEQLSNMVLISRFKKKKQILTSVWLRNNQVSPQTIKYTHTHNLGWYDKSNP